MALPARCISWFLVGSSSFSYSLILRNGRFSIDVFALNLEELMKQFVEYSKTKHQVTLQISVHLGFEPFKMEQSIQEWTMQNLWKLKAVSRKFGPFLNTLPQVTKLFH